MSDTSLPLHTASPRKLYTVEVLRIAAIVICLGSASGAAEAAVTCSPQNGTIFLGTFTAFADKDGGIAPFVIDALGPTIKCVATAEEKLTRLQMCATYKDANGIWPGRDTFSLRRQDGRTAIDSPDDRLILVPIDAQGRDVVAEDSLSSMLPGEMLQRGATGTATFPLRFRIQALPGAKVDPGGYAIDLDATLHLVETSGPRAAGGCSATSVTPGSVAMSGLKLGMAVDVREQAKTQHATAPDDTDRPAPTNGRLQGAARDRIDCNLDVASGWSRAAEAQEPLPAEGRPIRRRLRRFWFSQLREAEAASFAMQAWQGNDPAEPDALIPSILR